MFMEVKSMLGFQIYCELVDASRQEDAKERVNICKQIKQLESETKHIDKNLYCKMLRYKLCAGMDELSVAEKEKAISFGNAMISFEGVSISEESERDICLWKNGEKSFLSVFEDTLYRYGFVK